MKNGITVDVREFQGAVRDYLRMTSKSTSDALNGKAKDLALRAAQFTSKTPMSNADHTARKRSPAFVTHKTVEKYGRGFTRAQRSEVFESLQKTRLGKGFMKSGFVKASKLFRKTGDASKVARQSTAAQFDFSKATAKHATEKSLAALFDISWDAKAQNPFGGSDVAGKQMIVSSSVGKAVRFIVEDIRRYILKKQEQHAKKITASAGRAILKAFS